MYYIPPLIMANISNSITLKVNKYTVYKYKSTKTIKTQKTKTKRDSEKKQHQPSAVSMCEDLFC